MRGPGAHCSSLVESSCQALQRVRPFADDAVSLGMSQARRKVRRVGKWAGVVVVVLVLGMDLTSTWYSGEVFFGRFGTIAGAGGHVLFATGQVETLWGDGPVGFTRPTWKVLANPYPSDRTSFKRYYPQPGPLVGISMPLWFVAALTALPTAGLWWLDRKRIPGNCLACNYDLAGLAPGSKCPECGKPGNVLVPEKS